MSVTLKPALWYAIADNFVAFFPDVVSLPKITMVGVFLPVFWLT